MAFAGHLLRFSSQFGGKIFANTPKVKRSYLEGRLGGQWNKIFTEFSGHPCMEFWFFRGLFTLHNLGANAFVCGPGLAPTSSQTKFNENENH